MLKTGTALKLSVIVILLVACSWTSPQLQPNPSAAPPQSDTPSANSQPGSVPPEANNNSPALPVSNELAAARSRIKHIVIIMQENR